jgi:hypothetical protein
MDHIVAVDLLNMLKQQSGEVHGNFGRYGSLFFLEEVCDLAERQTVDERHGPCNELVIASHTYAVAEPLLEFECEGLASGRVDGFGRVGGFEDPAIATLS